MSELPGGLGMWVSSLEQWWRKSDRGTRRDRDDRNPLFVWEAIARCLNAEPRQPVPEWCLPYLAKAANDLTLLGWAAGRGEITTTKARNETAKALGLVRQGSKNAFARLVEDGRLMRSAYAEQVLGQPAEEGKVPGTERHVSVDRARRLRRRGRQLMGLGKTSA
jgi:hypothetical protein